MFGPLGGRQGQLLRASRVTSGALAGRRFASPGGVTTCATTGLPAQHLHSPLPCHSKQAFEKNPKDADTLANLVAVSLHLGKPSGRYMSQVRELGHACCLSMYWCVLGKPARCCTFLPECGRHVAKAGGGNAVGANGAVCGK